MRVIFRLAVLMLLSSIAVAAFGGRPGEAQSCNPAVQSC